MELKNRRKLLKVSQMELAQNVGVTNDYISNLERNNKIPSVNLIQKISSYLTKIAIEQNIPPELFSIENIFFKQSKNKMF